MGYLRSVIGPELQKVHPSSIPSNDGNSSCGEDHLLTTLQLTILTRIFRICKNYVGHYYSGLQNFRLLFQPLLYTHVSYPRTPAPTHVPWPLPTSPGPCPRMSPTPDCAEVECLSAVEAGWCSLPGVREEAPWRCFQVEHCPWQAGWWMGGLPCLCSKRIHSCFSAVIVYEVLLSSFGTGICLYSRTPPSLQPLFAFLCSSFSLCRYM